MAWKDNVVEGPVYRPYFRPNLLMQTDSYKFSHPFQYPPGLTSLFSYVESRGGRYGNTLFFGLQRFLMETLSSPVLRMDVDQAVAFAEAHGVPFPDEGWRHIVENHGGYLPVLIRAVPEGSVVPVHNVLATVESTDPKVPWVVSWLETALLRAVWYPTTVATISHYCKKVILEALQKSSDDPLGELPFKLHDFGGRGVSSSESAGIGGMAHLVNFSGSDTVEGILFAKQFYNHSMAGFSIPAAEHSTMTIGGREGELDQMRNMLKQFAKPGKVLAVVSDSYDIFNAVENFWGDALHDDVRESGATVVIRPDSGNPAEINVKLLQILERKIGMRKNLKGYKVLPKYFRLIQGDGNDNEDSIRDVLQAVMDHGYSASNIGFGMGGGLLQHPNRDTNKFAYKCSSAVVDGKEVRVFKDPITDKGKRSKAGRLDLIFREGRYQTLEGDQRDSALVPVYKDGKVLKTYTFDEVRRRSEVAL